MTEPASHPGEAGLARRLAVASAWTLLRRWSIRGIGLVSTLILIRLLSPEDFGIVTAAAVLNEILQSLTTTGFGLALIRMRTPARAHYDTVFTFSLLRGGVIGAALVATAGLQADFMREPRIVGVIHVMAVTALLGALENVRLVDLRRELRYELIMRYEVAKKLIGFAIALPLALWLRNYWALVVAIPLTRLVTLPIGYWLVPYRPAISLSAWRELLSFSKWIFLGNVFLVIQGHSVTLMLGRFTGMAVLGLYTVTRQLCELPVSEIAAPLRDPSYAGYARVWQDRATLRRYVLGILGLKTLIVLPMSAGIAVTGPELVPLALGARWLEAVPLVPMIAWIVVLNAVREDLTDVFIVLDRQAAYVTALGVLSVVRVGFGLWAVIAGGLVGLLRVLLATAAVNAVIWLWLACRYLGVDRRGLWEAIGRPWAAVAVMSGAVLALSPVLPAGLLWTELARSVAAKVAAGVVTYVGTVAALWVAAGRPSLSAESHALRAIARLRTRSAARGSAA